MKAKFFFLFLSVSVATLFISIKQGIAQAYYFRNYSVEDGLPFINVSTIFQDDKGNLWSGGYGGLSKFDGISFTNYTPKNGLLNHSVTTITQDGRGNLWIGTISGINKFDGQNFTSLQLPASFVSKTVTCSLKDYEGNVWIGTQSGLVKIVSESVEYYTTKQGLSSNLVKSIFEDKSKSIWIGTDKGLNKFSQNNRASQLTSIVLPFLKNQTVEINSIAEDFDSNIWIATNIGLVKYSNKEFNLYSTKEGLPDDKINCVLTDFRNTVWIGTDKGLTKYSNKKFFATPVQSNNNSNFISCLYQDFEHNLWIGTYNGMYLHRGNPFVSYGPNEGLFNNFIFGIIRDSKKNLWVGSQNGLFLNNSKTNSFFIKQSDFDNINVNAIYEYAPNKLWIGTNKGLRIIENNSLTAKKDTSSVFNQTINCFYIDSKKNIWIGGNNKVYKYDGKKFTAYFPKTINSNYMVWTFVEDKKGAIWIGTYLGGLIKYENGNFTECSKELGLTNDSYLTSLIDSTGNIYFGTLDGVWMFNQETKQPKLTHFSETDGMSSDLVYSLTFGKTQNEIWAGTNQGLNKIDIAEYKKSGKKNIIPFGKEEGFSGVECNSNGTWVDDDGSIWFGTVNSLIKYDPSEYIENTAESKISITGFRLFYKDTVLKNETHLAYNDNNITFTYSGICLTNPSKVKYSHILEGLEKNWSPPSTERLTRYSNLPSGKYTFKVISTNNEDVWNKKPASFSFTISKPFWKTWWFIISVMLLFSVSLYFLLRFRILQIKTRERQKTELNKKIANIESQALRAQMNPHFIFNTLSSIQHYISTNDIDAALKYLSKFAKLMRKIMDNSKQKMISVAEELDALYLYLELEVMRFDNKFIYEIEVDKAIDKNYDQIPSMLIQPYIENSIIHGLLPKQGEGRISIVMTKKDDTILCIIEDNGIGRQQSANDKSNSVQNHKSMGMSITQERLDILNVTLNGNIKVEIIDLFKNGNASGTRVELVIPIDTGE